MKKFLFGMAALLSASLFLLGCPTEADDDGGGDTSVDLSAQFFLRNGETAESTAGKDTSGLKIASAQKSSSGDVTIVLTGIIGPNYQAVAAATGTNPSTVTLGSNLNDSGMWTDTCWGGASGLGGATPGIYGAAYIGGLITQQMVDAGTIAIRQTNEALRLYAGAGDLVDKTAGLPAPTVPPAGNILIPDTGTPVKWKVYVNRSTKKPSLEAIPFGVLLWNGGSGTAPKIATLEIANATISGATATVEPVLLARYIIDYNQVTFPTAAELETALGGSTYVEIDSTDKNLVKVKANATASITGTVPVANGIKLEVPTGTTLSVAGTLTVAGELTVAGNATVSGKVTVASGGKIVSPALTNTGLPDTTNKISFTGTGAIELAQGAIGYYGTTAFIGPSGTTNYLYNWGTGTGGKVTLKGSNVTELTTGDVTCVVALDSGSPGTGIAADTTIVVASGATLTIKNGLAVQGTLTINGSLKGETGAILAIGTGDKVTVDGTAAATIFYPSDSTTAGTVTKNTIYKWTTDAGGGSTAGWKAQVTTP